MRTRSPNYLAAVATFAMLVPPLHGVELRAGVASLELQPPTGLLMAGFGARTATSTGTLDPLHAKVLVLEGAGTAVALVTLDLISVLPPAQLEGIRSSVRSSTGIADVIFNASHTHSGPYITDDPAAWQTKAAGEIAAAIQRAWKSRRGASIGIGRGSVLIGHNRLYYMRDGKGKMLWRNESRIATSPVDPTVMILRVDDENGVPIALLVNYACHPVVLGPENLRHSADYPGEMARIVEGAYPGAVCLFVQGGAGNINPYYDKTPLIDNAVGLMRETGRTLAKEVLRTAADIRTHPAPGSEIRIARDTLQFQGRWNREKMLANVRLQELSFDSRVRIERATHTSYQAPVTTLLLGREFAFVGVPAEIFVDYQMDIRARATDFPIIFGGYTNGNLGYVPTIKGAVDGGYGASQLGAYLEVGAGNRMIDTAVVRLAYWAGKLTSQPRPNE